MRFLLSIFFILSMFASSAKDKYPKKNYNETYRPVFHFSPEKNWLGSPCGLVYYEGKYHMFFQYNPKENKAGLSCWGHAESNDLVHWQEKEVAISPDDNLKDKNNNEILPGSVIVDKDNKLGKQTGSDKTLVAFYSQKNCGQKIAYSTDKGNTWQQYGNNPIIPFSPNDNACAPKVLWHNESQKWIMALYRQTTDSVRGISFYSSDDLVNWKWESHTPNFTGNPDLVKFKVSNRPNEEIWALIDVDGSYYLGSFDGKKFTPQTTKLKSDWGKNYYSPQTFNNIPETDGRTIQIAWMKNGKFPDMPFNGQMTFPCQLSVKKFPDGYRMLKKPVDEIEKIHFKRYSWENKNVIPGLNNSNKLRRVMTDCLDIVADFDVKTSNNFGFVFCHSLKDVGTEIIYNVKKQTLTVLGCIVPLKPVGNKIKFQILVDQSSIEVFANDGQVAISNCFLPNERATKSVLFTNGGELEIDKMLIFDIESIWKK